MNSTAGSAYYNDSANFLVYGGCKNFLGHDKACTHNVIVYPSFSAWRRRCVSDDNGEFANQYYYGNKCYEPDGEFYRFVAFLHDRILVHLQHAMTQLSWSNCNPNNPNTTVYRSWLNEFYSASGNWTVQCGNKSLNFTTWQQLGQDAGTWAISPSSFQYRIDRTDVSL